MLFMHRAAGRPVFVQRVLRAFSSTVSCMQGTVDGGDSCPARAQDRQCHQCRQVPQTGTCRRRRDCFCCCTSSCCCSCCCCSRIADGGRRGCRVLPRPAWEVQPAILHKRSMAPPGCEGRTGVKESSTRGRTPTDSMKSKAPGGSEKSKSRILKRQ